MIITDKAQIKAASFKESDKLHLTTSDELECYDLIESDLKLPADATFARSSAAYLSDGTQVDANMPRFEQGRFGKAIMVEEGTTNLVPNPLAKDNLTGIGYYFGEGSAGIIERSTSLPSGCPWLTGVKVTITTADTDANVIFKQTDGFESATGIPVTAGATYTYSIWLYIPSDSGITQLQLRPIEWNSSGGVVKDSALVSFNTKGVWQRVVATWTLQSTTAKVTLRVRAYGTGEFYATACMLEQKPYATSFIDGTRAAETLTIPTAGVLNPQEGTVEFWVKPLVVANWNNFFNMATSNGRFLLFFARDGRAIFDYGPSNIGPVTPEGTIEANNWYYIALRWSATTGKQALFIDGVKYEKDLPNGVATSFPSTVSVVNNYSAYIDDLRISSIARSDEEILAAYQSGEPLAADEWTTYKLDFDDKVRITTQGQIICNELIEI